jgi:hypothetical protein
MKGQGFADFRDGSKADPATRESDFRSTPETGLNSDEVDGSRSRHLGAKV